VQHCSSLSYQCHGTRRVHGHLVDRPHQICAGLWNGRILSSTPTSSTTLICYLLLQHLRLGARGPVRSTVKQHEAIAIVVLARQRPSLPSPHGKASCGQRSHHIDIRCFFITDHVKQQSITIEHCPTGIMLADFFTKPLQSSLFRMYRSVLLGEVPHSALSVTTPTAGNEERVEQGNPAGLGDSTPNRSTSVATAATDASHSFETCPVDAIAV
jgi:hypothetical protein